MPKIRTLSADGSTWEDREISEAQMTEILQGSQPTAEAAGQTSFVNEGTATKDAPQAVEVASTDGDDDLAARSAGEPEGASTKAPAATGGTSEGGEATDGSSLADEDEASGDGDADSELAGTVEAGGTESDGGDAPTAAEAEAVSEAPAAAKPTIQTVSLQFGGSVVIASEHGTLRVTATGTGFDTSSGAGQ